MLSAYQSDTNVAVALAVPSPGGTQLSSATSVEYAVYDEAGNVVVSRQPFAGYTDGDTEVTVTVAASDNALASGAVRGVRLIQVYFSSNGAEYTATGRYLINALDLLRVTENSFVTYEEALMTSVDMQSLDGWNSATEDEQKAALISSYLRLCRLNYRYRTVADTDRIDTGWFDPYERDAYGRVYAFVPDIAQMEIAEWNNTLPDDFKAALRRAQIREADVLLSGDPVGDMRQAGVISETVGESKVFLRPIPPVRTPVSRSTLIELKGFLHRRTIASRA